MSSPFLERPERDHVAGNALAFAILDGFPVSPGHTLVIPRRVVATWSQASAEERAALMALVDEVMRRLTESHHPDGFNVGFNEGTAAGQTVPHLHVHIIPRYLGDQADPRGGVRWVLPARADYWTER
jgi:diadenosine tetraphosphate (Ap4A) HIT family hydrolase